MANENYETGKVTIQSPDRFTELKEWNDFQKEKKAIQDKYPSRPWDIHTKPGGADNTPEEGWWEEWNRYKKEITDLILKPKGNFDKFMWKIKPEREQLPIEVWLRGAYNTDKYNEMRNRNERD